MIGQIYLVTPVFWTIISLIFLVKDSFFSIVIHNLQWFYSQIFSLLKCKGLNKQYPCKVQQQAVAKTFMVKHWHHLSTLNKSADWKSCLELFKAQHLYMRKWITSKACSEFMHSWEVSLTPWHQLQFGSTTVINALRSLIVVRLSQAFTTVLHRRRIKWIMVDNSPAKIKMMFSDL